MGIFGDIITGLKKRWFSGNVRDNLRDAESIKMILGYVYEEQEVPYGTQLIYVDKESSMYNTSQLSLSDKFVEMDGVRVASSYTTINEDGYIFICFCPEMIGIELESQAEEYDLDSSAILDIITQLVMHEVYHSHQFRYIYDTYGYSKVDQILDEEQTYAYGEGPIEKGALDYGHSHGEIKQDFSVVFR